MTLTLVRPGMTSRLNHCLQRLQAPVLSVKQTRSELRLDSCCLQSEVALQAALASAAYIYVLVSASGTHRYFDMRATVTVTESWYRTNMLHLQQTKGSSWNSLCQSCWHFLPLWACGRVPGWGQGPWWPAHWVSTGVKANADAGLAQCMQFPLCMSLPHLCCLADRQLGDGVPKHQDSTAHRMLLLATCLSGCS